MERSTGNTKPLQRQESQEAKEVSKKISIVSEKSPYILAKYGKLVFIDNLFTNYLQKQQVYLQSLK